MLVEICKKTIAFFLIGIVIKLLDDEVDENENIKYSSSILNELQKYKYPYSLIILAFAMLLENQYTFSLFSSAYMIGMFNFINRKLIFKLKSYHEIIILIIINLIFVPNEVFIHSFIIIMLIQIFDDLLDMQQDYIYGYFNLANKYGKGEILLLSIILITISIMLSPIYTVLTLLVWLLINYLYSER